MEIIPFKFSSLLRNPLIKKILSPFLGDIFLVSGSCCSSCGELITLGCIIVDLLFFLTNLKKFATLSLLLKPRPFYDIWQNRWVINIHYLTILSLK